MSILSDLVRLEKSQLSKPIKPEMAVSIGDRKAFARMSERYSMPTALSIELNEPIQIEKANRVFAGEAIPEELMGAIYYTSYSHEFPALKRYSPVSDGYRVKFKSSDVLDEASVSPKTTMSTLRELTTALEFAIFPLESLISPGPTSKFELLRPYADLFVVAPISMFSLEKHISSTEQNSQFYSPAFSQTFAAIAMSIPLWRTIKKDIKSLNDRMNDTSSRIQNVEQQMRDMQQQLNRIEEAAALERLNRIKAEERAQLNARSVFAHDPLAFAIKKGGNILGEEVAILGPCWGTDIPEAILKLSNLKEIKNQRKLFEQSPLVEPPQRRW